MADPYLAGWEPNDPPDDLDLFVAEEAADPAFRAALEAAEKARSEGPAPTGERCGEFLHAGPTGVWNCERRRGHAGACLAWGVVDDGS